MSVLERYGLQADSPVLCPAAQGIKCNEADVIDIATELSRNRTITSIDLSEAVVSPEAAKALGAALSKNTASVVLHLRLASCDIHADAMKELASLLSANDRLEVLELNDNPLRDEGAAAVASLLASSPSLRTVDLTACKIGRVGARALGNALADNTKLRNISLSNNKLRAAGITALVQGIKRNTALRVLDVSGNSINAEGGLSLAELLRANDQLESMNLARNFLSDAVPKIGHALSTRSRVMRLLDLSCNRIDSGICRALAQILEGNRISVACLSLEDNAIGDDGMVPLYHAVKGTGTQFLDLSFAGLTHRSGVVLADLIASCKALNSIQLDGNRLGDDAGVEIAVAFGESQSLTAINLERTGISDRTMHALTEAVQKHNHTRSLNLSENSINGEALLELLNALNTRHDLEEMDLSNVDVPESEVLLRALIDLFASNKKLSAVLLEHTVVGGSIPNSILTREVAASLLAASGGDASVLRTTHGVTGAIVASVAGGKSAAGPAATNASRSAAGGSGVVATVTQDASAVGKSKLELVHSAQTVFKPAWALTVPLDPPTHDADAAEDGGKPPLVPHPASLHDPLYPGYGKGRFSNGCLLQPLGNPLPYNVAVSQGQRRAFVPSADGAALVSAPPRHAAKESPYSLHSLEANPGQLPVTEDQLRRKFNELDVDGNGYLDRDEFKALYMSFQTFGLPMNQTEADGMFAKFSGADRKLQFDEFCILMLKLATR